MRQTGLSVLALLLAVLLPSAGLGVEKNLLTLDDLPGFERVETAHFAFFFHREDRMSQANFDAMESYLQDVTKKLEVPIPEKSKSSPNPVVNSLAECGS